ncbi:MAG: hypothetical protein HY863_09165 [Chloroflexi bacterium]|nr:hypothetical protein [Chloroflexota bacterium]
MKPVYPSYRPLIPGSVYPDNPSLPGNTEPWTEDPWKPMQDPEWYRHIDYPRPDINSIPAWFPSQPEHIAYFS